ncbi:hypothetical protein ScPMuIL_011675 [Solemya velum]
MSATGKGELAKSTPKPAQLYYCDVCKISCTGPQTYKEHLDEQKHKKKEAALQIRVNPQPTGCGPNQLLCKLCDVTFTSTDAYTAHIQGSNYQKVLELHTKLGKSIPSTDPVVVSTSTTSPSVFKIATNTVQTKPATEPLAKSVTPVKLTYKEHLDGQKHKKKEAALQIGANPQPTGCGPNQLLCKLCDVTFTSTDAYTAHIQGSNYQKVLELHTKLGKSIPSTDPLVVSTSTTSPSVFKTATNTVQTKPATEPLAKPVTPVAARQVLGIPKTTSVGGTQLKSLEAKPEEKTEATLAPTVITPEGNSLNLHGI